MQDKEKKSTFSCPKGKKKKKNPDAGCWWLMPAILATQEAEIRKTLV
jgi:hypothetical protein